MAGLGARSKGFALGLVIAAAVGARFFLAWTAPTSVDLESDRIVAIAWILGSHYGTEGSGRWLGQLLWLSVALWGAGEIRVLAAERRLAWRV